jgi:hypothetical protein
VSGTPRNRSPEATSRTPSAPAEVTRASMRAAAQRPTRASSGTPLSSFRPAPELELWSGTFRPRSCSNLPRERYRPLQGPRVPSTAKKPCAGSNPREAALVTAVTGGDGRNTLFLHEPAACALTGDTPPTCGDSPRSPVWHRTPRWGFTALLTASTNWSSRGC